MTDHGGCQSAYEREKSRADFAEARLDALGGDIYALAHKMDGIAGHSSQPRLDGMSLGGAVRFLLSEDRNRRKI